MSTNIIKHADLTKHFTTWMNEAKAEYIKRNNLRGEMARFAQCGRLEFASGLEISIRAGEYHYCDPRAYLQSYADYTQFELGFPNRHVPELDEWAEYMDEENKDQTQCIFPYTPREAIELMFLNNGGIVGFT